MNYGKETIFIPREDADVLDAFGFKYAAKKFQAMQLWYKVINYNKQGYVCTYQPV